jgi:hypothetical protein
LGHCAVATRKKFADHGVTLCLAAVFKRGRQIARVLPHGMEHHATNALHLKAGRSFLENAMAALRPSTLASTMAMPKPMARLAFFNEVNMPMVR